MGNVTKQISEHSTGCKGRFAPLAYTYSGETNMKKKDIIGLQCQYATKDQSPNADCLLLNYGVEVQSIRFAKNIYKYKDSHFFIRNLFSGIILTKYCIDNQIVVN